MRLSAAVRSTGSTPLLIAVYATLSITLSGQWIAAKLGVTAVPPLELSTMRFAIASVVLLAACRGTDRRVYPAGRRGPPPGPMGPSGFPTSFVRRVG